MDVRPSASDRISLQGLRGSQPRRQRHSPPPQCFCRAAITCCTNRMSRRMSDMAQNSDAILDAEQRLLTDLRRLRRSVRCETVDQEAPPPRLTPGQRVADAVARVMGSWIFIISQTVILFAWVAANTVGAMRRWDPYPFILLNLALSFQAAYAAPVIMMSQNRQQHIDRQAAENDYQVNVKAELEIELLHQKIDELRAQEVVELTEAVRCLTELLRPSRAAATAGPGATVDAPRAPLQEMHTP